MRTLLSLIVAAGIVSATTLAAADDPVETAAQKAAAAKKDNKPKRDRPQQEPTQANRREAGDDKPLVEPKAAHDDKPLVEPKAAHGDKVAPIRAGAEGATHVHKKHHRAVDSDKWLHDPTDGGYR